MSHKVVLHFNLVVPIYELCTDHCSLTCAMNISMPPSPPPLQHNHLHGSGHFPTRTRSASPGCNQQCSSPPPIVMGTCPICCGPITSRDDVFTLGCKSRPRNTTPHQIHCTPCGHQWLQHSVGTAQEGAGNVAASSCTVLRSVQCPICRDERSSLNQMRPGGTYAIDGCVLVLTWPGESNLPGSSGKPPDSTC